MRTEQADAQQYRNKINQAYKYQLEEARSCIGSIGIVFRKCAETCKKVHNLNHTEQNVNYREDGRKCYGNHGIFFLTGRSFLQIGCLQPAKEAVAEEKAKKKHDQYGQNISMDHNSLKDVPRILKEIGKNGIGAS